MTTYGAQKTEDKRLQRINSGRGHWYKMDGEKVQSVTSIANDVVPKPALVGWAAGAVAAEIYDDPDYYLKRIEKESRDSFIASMKGVPYKEKDQAANKGTAVHKLSERLALGEEVDVPEPLIGHVDSYLLFEKRHDPQDMAVEIVVGSFKHRYMGTLDMWAHLPRLKELGFCNCEHRCLSLVDIKTSRSGVWGEVMYQLVGYKNAEFYIDADGMVQNMPKLDHTFVLWVRHDGFDLKLIELTDDDFKAFRHGQRVAWTNTARLPNVVGQTLPIPKEQ